MTTAQAVLPNQRTFWLLLVLAGVLAHGSQSSNAKADDAKADDVKIQAQSKRTYKPIFKAIERPRQIQQGNEIAKAIIAALKKHKTPLNNAADAHAYTRVRRIFNRLLSVSHLSDEDWKVVLIGDSGFDAFTTGGSYLFVHAGLEQRANDDALGAAIAHALGHIAANHAYDIQHYIQLGGLISAQTPQQQTHRVAFSLKQEAEADALALLYTALAGYDPRAAYILWARKYARPQDIPMLMRSHPSDLARVEHIRRVIPTVLTYYVRRQINENFAAILEKHRQSPRNKGRYQPDSQARKQVRYSFDTLIGNIGSDDAKNRAKISRLDESAAQASKFINIIKARVSSIHALKISYTWKGNFTVQNIKIKVSLNNGTTGYGHSGGPIEPGESYGIVLNFQKSIFSYSDVGKDLAPEYLRKYFRISVEEIQR